MSRLFSVPAPRGTFIAWSTLPSPTEDRTRPRLRGPPLVYDYEPPSDPRQPHTSLPNRHNSTIVRTGLAHPRRALAHGVPVRRVMRRNPSSSPLAPMTALAYFPRV